MMKHSFLHWLPEMLTIRVSVRLMILASSLLYLAVYFSGSLGPPIRADGEGYYAYLPAFIIHGDPSFRTLAEKQYEGSIPDSTGLSVVTGDGRYLNKYGIGPAVLALPFFLIAHLLTWIMQSPPGAPSWFALNYPCDGYSLFYQHAIGLSAIFYGVTGLALLGRFLRRYVSEHHVSIAMLFCFFGTNLWYYVAGDGFGNHSYSFFLYACLLLVIQRWFEDPAIIRNSIWLGVVLGMIGLVRLPNLAVGVVFLLYGVGTERTLRQQGALFIRHAWPLFAGALAAALVIYVQAFAHYLSIGEHVLNGYGAKGRSEGFNFMQPAIWQVLFSLQRGWFFWSPMCVVGLLGIVALWMKKSPLRLAIIAAIGIKIYLVASWHMWWYGGGFGHRAFVEELVFVIVGLASLFESVPKKVRNLLMIICLCFGVWTLFWLKLFLTRELSVYGIDWPALFDVFYWRLKGL